MKYLKLFETESEYQAYVDSGEMILPNVSFIREIKRCGFKPYVEPPKVTLNYDCTEDNLLAFSNGSKNIKALKIDGKNIEIPPIITSTSTVEILADEVSYNAETELYEFPDNYSMTSVPTSLVIKPKDSSIKVTDANIGCVGFILYEGMKMCEPVSLSGAEDMIVIDEVNNQIVFTDSFLQEMRNVISMGYGYGFGLCNIIDLDSYQFDIIDSIQIYEGTSGGVATPYYFETPGVHTVEMELLNGDFGQMNMFYNPLMGEFAPLTSVIFNKNITSISQYTFVNNSTLSEITCESEIAPAINYSFVNIRKFGTLHYPEGSDYSSWLEGEGSLSEYSWNKEQPILTTKYNITDTTSPTKLCYDASYFTDIIIDGTPMSPLENSYTFSTTGEHEVIYKLDDTSIGISAFSGCSGLTAITIPDGVTSIGRNAFYDCSILTEITCNAIIAPTIYSDTFYGVKKFGILHYPEGSDYSSWLRTNPSYLGYYSWNKEQPILTAKYNITDTTSLTKICDDTSDFTEIIIDGTPMSQLENSYTFSTTGEHEVVYKLNYTSIDINAFQSCSGLTAITIPSDVTSIGDNAFWGCSGLTAITIPDSVTKIGSGAFSGCSGLTAITIPDSVTKIGSSAFQNCSKLTAITIPDSVTEIGNYAFYGCTGLTAITIPDSVTSIGSGAFQNCSKLTAITIPDSVTEIGNYAFYGCSGLTAITCNATIAPTISTNTFYGVKKFGTLHYPEGSDYSSWMSTDSYYLGYYSWNKEQPILTTKYNITDTTSPTKICNNTSCFTDIIIDGTPMSPLENSYTFSTTGEHEVIYKLGGTDIGYGPFFGCSGLTAITIPSDVTSIGDNAFWGCSGLTAITCNATIAPTISTNTFSGVKKFGTLHYPEGSDYSSWLRTDAYYLGYYSWNKEQPILTTKYNITDTTSPTKICDDTSNFTDIIIDGTPMSPLENSYTFSTTGEHEVIYKLGGTEIIRAFYGCSGLAAITIPDSVNKIGDDAFRECPGLTAITIPNSVTSIGGWAFSDCTGLTAITIPNSVTYIGSGAFSGCSGLTAITIPDSVNEIGDSAFRECPGLTAIEVTTGNMTYDSRENCNCIIETNTNTLICGCKNSTIPDSVTSIGVYAFYGCSGLAAITIPDSVTSIGNGAFGWCNSLTSITIPNSVTSIGGWAFIGCSGLAAITIPDSVNEIGDQAFYGCSGLAAITIPDSVNEIGEYAFYGCNRLTAITCNATIAPVIKSNTFNNVKNNGTLYIPSGSDYSSWMSSDANYLGYYNWTVEYI